MKVTLEPPSEEEDDTVVESTESESDPAEDFFKKQNFDDQRNLVSAKDPVRRRGTLVLNQNSFDVKIGEVEERKRDNIREGSKLQVEKRKTPEEKCEKMEEAEENNFKTSSSGEKRRPVQFSDQEEWSKETKIDENCGKCLAAEEVKGILEELENIKQRISQIEHDVLKRIVL